MCQLNMIMFQFPHAIIDKILNHHFNNLESQRKLELKKGYFKIYNPSIFLCFGLKLYEFLIFALITHGNKHIAQK